MREIVMAEGERGGGRRRETEREGDERETRKGRGRDEGGARGGRVIVETDLRRSVKSGQQMLA